MLSFTESGVYYCAICCWHMQATWIRSTSSFDGTKAGSLLSFMAFTMLFSSWYLSVSRSAVLGVVVGSCFCSLSCISQSMN